MSQAAALEARLAAVLRAIGPSVVAVSGGVDSMTLAHVAARTLGPAAGMVHAVSPAVPAAATQRVRAHGARFNWRLTCTEAGEFSDPDYLKNPVNRCYFCKNNLYDRIKSEA
ncbi:MAG: adenine nucleotide alpha hydrolase, partial [Pseudomonadota bacterium]|nr:adenine nucleotide alpha hydrolase [Pseudomonadota bacterium]